MLNDQNTVSFNEFQMFEYIPAHHFYKKKKIKTFSLYKKHLKKCREILEKEQSETNYNKLNRDKCNELLKKLKVSKIDESVIEIIRNEEFTKKKIDSNSNGNYKYKLKKDLENSKKISNRKQFTLEKTELLFKIQILNFDLKKIQKEKMFVDPLEIQKIITTRYMLFLNDIAKNNNSDPDKFPIQKKNSETKRKFLNAEDYLDQSKLYKNAINESIQLIIQNSRYKNNCYKKAKRCLFNEIQPNQLFLEIIDKVFRKVCYITEKNVPITEQFVLNLLTREMNEYFYDNIQVTENGEILISAIEDKTLNPSIGEFFEFEMENEGNTILNVDNSQDNRINNRTKETSKNNTNIINNSNNKNTISTNVTNLIDNQSNHNHGNQDNSRNNLDLKEQEIRLNKNMENSWIINREKEISTSNVNNSYSNINLNVSNDKNILGSNLNVNFLKQKILKIPTDNSFIKQKIVDDNKWTSGEKNEDRNNFYIDISHVVEKEKLSYKNNLTLNDLTSSFSNRPEDNSDVGISDIEDSKENNDNIEILNHNRQNDQTNLKNNTNESNVFNLDKRDENDYKVAILNKQSENILNNVGRRANKKNTKLLIRDNEEGKNDKIIRKDAHNKKKAMNIKRTINKRSSNNLINKKDGNLFRIKHNDLNDKDQNILNEEKLILNKETSQKSSIEEDLSSVGEDDKINLSKVEIKNKENFNSVRNKKLKKSKKLKDKPFVNVIKAKKEEIEKNLKNNEDNEKIAKNHLKVRENKPHHKKNKSEHSQTNHSKNSSQVSFETDSEKENNSIKHRDATDLKSKNKTDSNAETEKIRHKRYLKHKKENSSQAISIENGNFKNSKIIYEEKENDNELSSDISNEDQKFENYLVSLLTNEENKDSSSESSIYVKKSNESVYEYQEIRPKIKKNKNKNSRSRQFKLDDFLKQASSDIDPTNIQKSKDKKGNRIKNLSLNKSFLHTDEIYPNTNDHITSKNREENQDNKTNSSNINKGNSHEITSINSNTQTKINFKNEEKINTNQSKQEINSLKKNSMYILPLRHERRNTEMQQIFEALQKEELKKYARYSQNPANSRFSKIDKKISNQFIQNKTLSEEEKKEFQNKLKYMRSAVDKVDQEGVSKESKKKQMIYMFDLNQNIEYNMNKVEISEDQKKRYEELMDNLESFKKFDLRSYVDNIEKNYKDIKEEIIVNYIFLINKI